MNFKSLTSTLGIIAEDNYSNTNKIAINYTSPLAPGFDDDENYIPDAVGSYILEYFATDENGNISTSPLNFTVNVTEVPRPVISYTGVDTLAGLPYKSVEAGEPVDIEDETLMQLTATDSKGADMISPDIYAFKLNNYDPNKIGTYTVQYKVEDSYGRESLPFNYTLEVSDTKGPKISGETSLSSPLNYGDKIDLMDLTILRLTVNDSFDPAPQLILQDDGGFKDDGTDSIGTYSLKYDAKDNSGNLTSSAGSGYYAYTIKVADLSAPTITGLTQTTVDVGSTIDQAYIDNYLARGLTIRDNIDTAPSVTAKFVDATGASIIPNSSIVGDILVNYDATDATGNNYSDVSPIGVGKPYTYTIHVVDMTAPQITGPTSQEVDFGLNSKNLHTLDATDLGLTITDNSDERPQLILASDSDVYDGTKVGTYNMQYIAIDKYDNKSASYSYTINVTAQDPIITTSGDQETNISTSVTDDWINHPENVGISATGEDADFNGINDDITSLITVKENGGFDSTKIGTYPITYQVTDPVSTKIVEATINIEVKSAIKPSFYGEKSAKITEGTKFDINTSESTNLYVITDHPMTLEDAIAKGILKVDNYGTDNDSTTIADNFNGDGKDPEGTYLIEYTASYNGYDVVQKYSINVVPANKPHIIGKNKLTVNNEAIPYSDPKAMGLTGVSTVFTDITKDITGPIIRDESGDITTLDEAGSNPRGTYVLEYNLHDPIQNTDADPFYYTVKVVALAPPIFTYTPPAIEPFHRGMIDYTYDENTYTANETWQGSYDAKIAPETRLTSTSSDGTRDLPIMTETTDAYNKNKVGTYHIVYKTMDPWHQATAKFNLNIDVVDTLPPEFIGDTEYTNIYNTKFGLSDLTLSTLDSVDGANTEWSDTLAPGKMTIISNVSVDDPSISFTGSGLDTPGIYQIKIETEDEALNTAYLTVQISQTGQGPVYVGTPTQTFNLTSEYSDFYVVRPTSDGDFSSEITHGMMVDMNTVKFTDYAGKTMTYIKDYVHDPATNTKNGTYLYKSTYPLIDKYGTTLINLGAGGTVVNTYCSTMIYGEVNTYTCQDVTVTKNNSD